MTCFVLVDNSKFKKARLPVLIVASNPPTASPSIHRHQFPAMISTRRFLLLFAFFCCFFGIKPLRAQEPAVLAQELAGKMQDRFGRWSLWLQQKHARFEARLRQKETRMLKRLLAFDSLAAASYTALQTKLSLPSPAGAAYDAPADSLQTALRFLDSLQQRDTAMKRATGVFALMHAEAGRIKSEQGRSLNVLRSVRQRVHHPKALRALRRLEKARYYQQLRVAERFRELSSFGKLQEQLMSGLRASAAFQEFFARNAQVAQLFSLPAPGSQASINLAGLQTRAGMSQTLAQRFGNGAQATEYLQKSLSEAQAQLDRLKNKIKQAKSGTFGNGDADLSFKPNTQKTKAFWKRLEWGANVQSQRGSTFFPATTEFGLQVGYKLNDRFTAGVGTAFRMGWGQRMEKIRISSEGLSLRSFVHYALPRGFLLAGGYEQVYRMPLPVATAGLVSGWRPSGLIGVGKQYRIGGGKVQGDVRMLWDFLSYQQAPRTQPFVFRFGYRIK